MQFPFKSATAALAFLVLLPAPPCGAADSRFLLANQSDFLAKRGFYVDFENSTADANPCKLATLRLILAAGDGTRWRYAVATPQWEFGHTYSVRAVIGEAHAELRLDSKLVQGSDGGFMPREGAGVEANLTPDWASGPTAYRILQESVTLAQTDGKRTSRSFAADLSRPPGLALFEPHLPVQIPWTMALGQTLTVTARFRIAPPVDVTALRPFIDRYGQARYDNRRGKVKTDEDLLSAMRDEDTRLANSTPPTGRDRFGGATNAGWNGAATGKFQVTRHDGFWWLLTPDGAPCFYTGVCTAPSLTWDATPVTGREGLFSWLPSRDGQFGQARSRDPWGADPGTDYVSFQAVNLIRKYGTDWQPKARRSFVTRLKAWGFCGLGKWSENMPGIPSLPVLGLAGVPKLVDHPDIFDPAVREQIRTALRRQIEPRRNDPNVVGWSIGNEIDEIITKRRSAPFLPGRPARRPGRPSSNTQPRRSTAATRRSWHPHGRSVARIAGPSTQRPRSRRWRTWKSSGASSRSATTIASTGP